MDIIKLKLDEFVEYKRNPRKNDHAVERLAQSIKEFGFRVPILIKRDKTIIDGHLRLKAARCAGLKEVDAVYIDDLTDAQIKAFRIAINRMAELAEWDEELLGIELQEMREMDFDLDLTGFDTGDIDDFINAVDKDEVANDDDNIDPPAAQVKSKLGDIWICGKHRIMCGDWLDDEHRKELMNGQKAHLIFTDPPYNAAYTSRMHRKTGGKWDAIVNDNMSASDYEDFIKKAFTIQQQYIEKNASLYACIDWKSYPVLAHHLGDFFTHKSTIIWNKGHFGLGDKYRPQYEMILFCVIAECFTWNAGQEERDVWDISRDSTKGYEHPTQKPIAIPERAILNSSNNGDIVLDMFCGSGSTMAACQQQGRKCFTIDIEPRYVDVAVARYQHLSGQKAVNEETGEFFDDRTIQDGSH